MVRMFVRHQVKDYATWRKGYDAFGPLRTKMGAQAHGVYRGVEDSNDVTVWHDFESIESARNLAGSEELKNAMKAAGVLGAPTIWLAHQS